MVVLITASFGALWDLLGAAAALPGTPSSVAALLTVVVTTAFLLAAARLLLLSRRLPRSSASAGTNPFRSRAYLLAVLFEVVAIPVAVVLLNRAGYPGAVGSVIVAIVGLHFFGLVPAFKSRRWAARWYWSGCCPCCYHPSQAAHPAWIRGGRRAWAPRSCSGLAYCRW